MAEQLARGGPGGDAAIGGALRRRDAGAIGGLVERYGSRLLRYLVHLTGERALSDDLFQETWVRVLERGDQYDPQRPFSGWLFGIARHAALDALRRTRPIAFEALEDNRHEAIAKPGTAASPLERLIAREARERVAYAVAQLPSASREVLFLRFAEEMSLQEIGRVTGVPLPTVKSRLYRALDQLAGRLREEP